ncbi:MAG TPA: site-specific DNA-methyltransferase [Phycisphaerae bacterium]|nr:site-specific DNA-methyltransferase [Phycisphaerae bacterium]
MKTKRTSHLDHIAATLRPLAVRVDVLRPDPANTRIHDARNMEALEASLLRFGQQKPIVVDRKGIVIAGNATLEAARRLGWRHVAAVRTTLVGADRTAYGIADNRTAELAAWDVEALGRLLKELGDEETILAAGFTAEEMQAVLDGMLGQGPADGLTDPDTVPGPPDEAVTRPGDLWVLGNHRLLCGDSSKAEDVDRLLAGARIHLVNTDPPYNVKVEPRSNNAIAAGLSSFPAAQGTHRGLMHHQSFDVARQGVKAATTKKLRPKDRPLVNDFVSDEDFDRMLRAWFGNMARVLLPGRCFYIWGGYANLGNYPPVLKACELYFSQGIVWDKEWPVLTRKDFMGAFEICFYGWREGAGHKWFGPTNATDLWHIRKIPPPQMQHLTEKPVELAVRAIQYSSRPGENVLDLFGGSGSTLIGCEQTGRRAYLMELDTLYCDVIVQRWEQFTGGKAELEGACRPRQKRRPGAPKRKARRPRQPES